MENELKSRVYALCDEHNSILRIEGEYTLPKNLDNWVLLEEGEPCDRLNLAQTHYISGALLEEHGIPLYTVENGEVVRRTDAMVKEDIAAIPEGVEEPTQEDRMDVLEGAILELAAMLAEVERND